MTGLDRHRVAEVIVAGGRRGTGYRLTERLLLTACHAVRDAAEVRVRFDADQPGEWTAKATPEWSHPGIDVAVLALADVADGGQSLEPVQFAGIEDVDGELTCTVMGFPRFKLRRDPGPAPDGGYTEYRDTHHEVGVAAPWSNLREATIAISVRPPEHDVDPARSPWEGMSGAPVWSDGRLIGVVIEHHRTDGLGRLAASRVDSWHEKLTEQEARRLAELLGLPAGLAELERVRVPRTPEAVEAERLDEAVRELLEAERRAADLQPYRIFGEAAPPLSRVYVDQRAADRAAGADDGAPAQAPEPIPAADIVARHRNALVEGGPGSGKSTLTQHVASVFAASGLGADGPAAQRDLDALAIRIPARDLVGDAPLSAQLRASVRGRLSRRLTRDLPEGLFDGPVAGKTWLLLVDGLDEIADRRTRQDIVEAISAHASRETSPYRWLVTTRPLATRELEPLDAAAFGRFVLRPFEDDELRSLAERWIGNGDAPPEDASAGAERFLELVREAGLGTLVRVPLLAAIALLIHSRDPSRKLPPGRPSLYREFVDYLLGGREGERHRQPALEDAVQSVGGSTALAVWLGDNRVPLLTWLAERTLAADVALVPEALGWIERHSPADVRHLPGWAQIVGDHVAATGLLTVTEAAEQLEWIHRSFAEYLAAEAAAAQLAADWPGPDPDTDPFLRSVLQSDQREQGVLTIACWAQRRDTSIEPLLAHVIARSPDYRQYLPPRGPVSIINDDSSQLDDYAWLAGRLLAEGIPAPEELSDAVLDLLVRRASALYNSGEFCALIAAQPRREIAAGALHRIIDSQLSISVRCHALVALGRVFGVARALEAAAPLLRETGPANVQLIASGGVTIHGGLRDARVVVASQLALLGEPAHGIARRLLEEAYLPAADYIGAWVALDAYAVLGDMRTTAAIAERLRDDPHGVEPFVRTMLDIGRPERIDAHVAEQAERVATGRLDRGRDRDVERAIEVLTAVAGTLMDLGEGDLVARVARSTLQALAELDRRLSEDEADQGLGFNAWLARRAAKARARVAALLALSGDTAPAIELLDGPAPADVELWPDLARALASAGRRVDVVSIVARQLSGGVDERQALSLADALEAVGDPAARQLWAEVAQLPAGSPNIRRRAAERLLNAGDREAAREALVELARGTIKAPDEAAEIALVLARAGAREEAVRLIERDLAEVLDKARRDADRWSGSVLHRRRDDLRAFAEIDKTWARRYLVALSRGTALTELEEMQDVARSLVDLGEREVASDLLERIVREFCAEERGPSASQLCSIAALLDATGEPATATSVYAMVLDRRFAEDDIDVDDALRAAERLHAANQLDARRRDALATVGLASVDEALANDGGRYWPRVTNHDEDGLVRVARLLDEHGAHAAAAQLLRKTLEGRAKVGDEAHPSTIAALADIEARLTSSRAATREGT